MTKENKRNKETKKTKKTKKIKETKNAKKTKNICESTEQRQREEVQEDGGPGLLGHQRSRRVTLIGGLPRNLTSFRIFSSESIY